MKDCRGNPVSTHSQAALAHFEHALWCLGSFYDTPLADLDQAALADPGWMLPPVMRAAFLLTLTEPGLVPQAREALVAAEALSAPATPREQAHLSAALLWRLKLLGVDGGERWQALAERYAAADDAGFYAFNDLFALLAFIGAGDLSRARAVLRDASGHAESRDVDNIAMSRDVGLPLMRGMLAFAEGRPDDAVRLMQPVRDIAHRFGGSHAQRDLLDQTLLAASADGSFSGLGRSLLNERRSAKPLTPLTSHWMQRVSG